MIDQKEGETELSVKVHYDDMVSVTITFFICFSCNFELYLKLSQGHLRELVSQRVF